MRIKQFGHRDSLADRRRRAFSAKIFFIAVGSVLLVGGSVYAFFFSPVFQIRDIDLTGLQKVDSGEVMARIISVLEEKKFSYIPANRNIMWFASDKIAAQLLVDYPVLKTAVPKKKLFHTVSFEFTERGALGTWCFHPPAGGDCSYFDEDGKLWGKTGKSSGSLFLAVNDARVLEEKKIDPELLAAVKSITKGTAHIGLGIRQVSIPAEFFREFQVQTSKGYPLLLNLDSDISEQLNNLGAFLEKKREDKTFAPAYIDLRIDGRIYYR